MSNKNGKLPKELINTPQKNRMSLPRRDFIVKSLAGSSAIMLYGCGGGSSGSSSAPTLPTTTPPTTTPPTTTPPQNTDTPGALSATTSPQSIVIIGAGASGLVAAYELERAGHDVTVLEARERVGGRIYTLREPFSEGLFAEAGASRIPSNHDLTLGYAQHFELALDPFYANSQNYVNITGGAVAEIDAQSYISQPPWPGAVNRNQFQKIRGGMEQLPLAMANALSSNVRFQSVVTSISQDLSQQTQGAVVTLADGQVISADRVLCTVPLPVLSNIDFQPALSAEKQAAINGGYSYAPSSRLYTQSNSRFWENQGRNGWGNSDFPEEIWQPTWDANATGGIIQSYMFRSAAAQFEALTFSEQIDTVHQRLSQAFPDLPDNIASTHVHSWSNEIYSGNAFAAPTQAQASQLDAHIGAAEGRIHFAGEHASNFHAWIQGALESGIRAAREIHGAGG